jgi:hypothetical protein
MRINELCESLEFDLDKPEKDPNDPHGLGFDLKDDLMFFMHHDDNAYRKHTFPAIMACKDRLDAGKDADVALFDKAVKECYNQYVDKFNIKQLPLEPDQKLLDEMCKHLLDDETQKIKDGHYGAN